MPARKVTKGMVTADNGKGKLKKKTLKKGIAGLTNEQAKGGTQTDEEKEVMGAKPKGKRYP